MSPSERLPDITHLQFLVLTALRNRECRGRELRALLRSRGVRRSGPAFYQMMARLEDAGLVQGEYEQRVEDGRGVKERRYAIAPAGESAWGRTRDFYLGELPGAERAEAADA